MVVEDAFFDVQLDFVVQVFRELLRQSRLVQLHQPHVHLPELGPDQPGGLGRVNENIVDRAHNE